MPPEAAEVSTGTAVPFPRVLPVPAGSAEAVRAVSHLQLRTVSTAPMELALAAEAAAMAAL